MEIALFVTLLVIVYLIVLNWHMNGALKIRIYVALFVPWLALLAVMCLDVRAKGHPIVKDTEPPNDPAHGLVLGKKTGSFANAMLSSHRWIVPPPKQQ